MWSRFKTLDPFLYLLPLVLMVVSVVVIYTLTNDTAGINTAVRQGIFALGGLALMVIATFIDYRNFKGWIPWMYGIGLTLLVLVQIRGESQFGASRWINLGFFQLQPGEVFKFIIIVILAALLSRTSQKISGRQFFLALFLILLPAVAVVIQPDLGTALVLSVTGMGMILYGRVTLWQRITVLSLVGIVILSILLSFKGVAPFGGLLKPYQKERLISFLDSKADPQGSGYNIRQSKIAIGSGGLVGKGLGQGTQSQLNFLPVAQADFIFAGIAEAWGLIGSYGLIIIFFILNLRILHAARIAKDDFGMLICIGVMIKLLFEILVNMGMNLGIMPVTGIPLPFLSYGGTTMLTNALLIGIVQSIVVRYKRLTF